ncbi:MAG: peroxiredoxin [Myxococcales bacterium]|nr:peroxiredoxin [Myxococcales bacterium]
MNALAATARVRLAGPALGGSLWLLLLASACGGASKGEAAAEGGLLSVGAAAPEVVAETADGKALKLSQLKGQPVAVYFYPKDETPGCTKQACAFRDAWEQLQSAGVHVIGVSRDDAESHRAFRAHHKLPFPLAADTDGALQAAFGVPSRAKGIASRVTFLVGPDGKIAKVWPKVDPAVDAENVIAAAKGL